MKWYIDTAISIINKKNTESNVKDKVEQIFRQIDEIYGPLRPAVYIYALVFLNKRVDLATSSFTVESILIPSLMLGLKIDGEYPVYYFLWVANSRQQNMIYQLFDERFAIMENAQEYDESDNLNMQSDLNYINKKIDNYYKQLTTWSDGISPALLKRYELEHMQALEYKFNIEPGEFYNLKLKKYISESAYCSFLFDYMKHVQAKGITVIEAVDRAINVGALFADTNAYHLFKKATDSLTYLKEILSAMHSELFEEFTEHFVNIQILFDQNTIGYIGKFAEVAYWALGDNVLEKLVEQLFKIYHEQLLDEVKPVLGELSAHNDMDDVITDNEIKLWQYEKRKLELDKYRAERHGSVFESQQLDKAINVYQHILQFINKQEASALAALLQCRKELFDLYMWGYPVVRLNKDKAILSRVAAYETSNINHGQEIIALDKKLSTELEPENRLKLVMKRKLCVLKQLENKQEVLGLQIVVAVSNNAIDIIAQLRQRMQEVTSDISKLSDAIERELTLMSLFNEVHQCEASMQKLNRQCQSALTSLSRQFYFAYLDKINSIVNSLIKAGLLANLSVRNTKPKAYVTLGYDIFYVEVENFYFGGIKRQHIYLQGVFELCTKIQQSRNSKLSKFIVRPLFKFLGWNQNNEAQLVKLIDDLNKILDEIHKSDYYKVLQLKAHTLENIWQVDYQYQELVDLQKQIKTCKNTKRLVQQQLDAAIAQDADLIIRKPVDAIPAVGTLIGYSIFTSAPVIAPNTTSVSIAAPAPQIPQAQPDAVPTQIDPNSFAMEWPGIYTNRI